MEDNVLTQIRNLKIKIDEKEKTKLELKKQAHDLLEEYENLMNRIVCFNEDIKNITSQIQKLEKCPYSSHSVEFCYRNYGQENCYSYCLCCGQEIMGVREDMELYNVIDGREYVKNSNLTVSEIINNAKEEYHLLRECYYKYPGVLNDEKLDTTIYKVMRKRYEINS